MGVEYVPYPHEKLLGNLGGVEPVPNSHTVQGGGVHLYRLLTIAEILRASPRPGRCDKNFCDGSFCNASFCRLALIFVFVHPTQQWSSQSSRFAIGRYTYRYTCIFICIRCCNSPYPIFCSICTINSELTSIPDLYHIHVTVH